MKYAINDKGVLRDVVMTHPSILFIESYAQQFIQVPDDAQNGWHWDGATASPPPVPPKTPEQIQAEIVAATQARLDAFARTCHYDDIKSASDYAGCSVPKFDVEGTYCRDARALTWARLYELLAEVEAGTRPMPTGFADVESELPPLVWPTP